MFVSEVTISSVLRTIPRDGGDGRRGAGTGVRRQAVSCL